MKSLRPTLQSMGRAPHMKNIHISFRQQRLPQWCAPYSHWRHPCTPETVASGHNRDHPGFTRLQPVDENLQGPNGGPVKSDAVRCLCRLTKLKHRNPTSASHDLGVSNRNRPRMRLASLEVNEPFEIIPRTVLTNSPTPLGLL